MGGEGLSEEGGHDRPFTPLTPPPSSNADPGLPALAWNASFLGASAQQAGLMQAEAAPFQASGGFVVGDGGEGRQDRAWQGVRRVGTA